MKVYRAATDVPLSIPLIDDEGRPLSPTALAYRVLDDEGEEVQASTSVSLPSGNKVNLTIPAATNTLVDNTIGFRRIELTITAATTEVVLVDYLLEEQQLFVVPENSFMTYETALIVARSTVPLNGWNAASEETRKFALFRAFDQLNSFSYEFRYTNGDAEVATIEELDEESYARLTTKQLGDFRKAQLMQADYLLGGSPIERDIQDGLQSSTVGEVSQFYRPRPTLNLAVCKNALSYIGKYIDWNVRLGRA